MSCERKWKSKLAIKNGVQTSSFVEQYTFDRADVVAHLEKLSRRAESLDLGNKRLKELLEAALKGSTANKVTITKTILS